MEIIRINYRNIPELQDTIACIGFFDGLHRGHQGLVKKSIQWAKEEGLPSSMITFDPDPWKIFYPDKRCEHLTTIQDRVQIAKKLGVDVVYILTFSIGFAANNVDEFHQILEKMHISNLLQGIIVIFELIIPAAELSAFYRLIYKLYINYVIANIQH